MPSTSSAQRRFMAAAAHDPKFAADAGIEQHVAKEFHAADKAKRRVARKLTPKELAKALAGDDSA